jgi:O-antigen ligase
MIFSNKQHQTIHHYGLMLFAFLLPLSAKIATWFIVLLLLNWLVGLPSNKTLNQLKTTGPLLLLLFFAWHLLALIYTQDIGMGFHKLETKLSLLIFPLLLTSSYEEKSTAPASWHWAFVLGNGLAALLSLGAATWSFLATGENLFFYQNLSGFLRLHPTYFAANLGLALFFLIQDRLLFADHRSLAKGLLIILLAVTFLLLSARMAFVAVILLGMISWIAYAVGRPGFFKRSAVGLGFLGLVITLLFLLPGPGSRIQRAIENNTSGPGNVRFQIWDAAWDLIQEAPLIGLGTGDAPSNLLEQYQQLDYQTPFEKKLNAHNQYIQNALAIGIPGSLFWLSTLLFFLRTFLRKREFAGAFFIGLCLLLFLTESMLETQKGNLWFGFFCMLFWIRSQSSQLSTPFSKDFLFIR